MGKVLSLRCVICKKDYEPRKWLYVCPSCGERGTLDCIYGENLKGPFPLTDEESMFRYSELLPVERSEFIAPLRVGWTPLYSSRRLSEHIGLREVLIKDDTRNPTASLKDRASITAVAKSLEWGAKAMSCASTGNAASSVAGISASMGIQCFLFVPQGIPEAKLIQLLAYGAVAIPVQGTYDEAYDLSIKAGERWSWFIRSSGYNPYLSEGKKTVAFEIAEQTGWECPDSVFVSAGDGCILGSLWKGFSELVGHGLLRRLPRIFGVQAEGCNPLEKAYLSGNLDETGRGETIADSICVRKPRDIVKGVRAARESGGKIFSVSDREILEACRTLAQETGIFAEPAGGASFAGLLKALREGFVSKTERAAVIVTGSGLKDISSFRGILKRPEPVRANLGDVRRYLEEQGVKFENG